ncbi:MAG: hypothetical protein ACRYGI_16570 [Janthinobacterium lividum]
MAIRTIVARSLSACLLTLAVGSIAAPQAMAQHMVTDGEAGKLTLDSLTATPAPVYRRVIAYHTPRASRSNWSSAVRGGTVRGVHSVVYHHAYRQPVLATSHHVASHRRVRG